MNRRVDGFYPTTSWANLADMNVGGSVMKTVIVIGAGKIGATIADLLGGSGDYRVIIADRSEEQLSAIGTGPNTATRKVDITDEACLARLLRGAFAVLSAAPYDLTTRIAEAAAAQGVHYLDLTEDVASTRRVKELALTAKAALIPQCGLAPGFISIVAADLARGFDQLDSLKLRVGALPQYPSNALNYNLTWSTDGLINEYCEPCEAIVNGERVLVPALEEREEFSLDGVTYEAFNTSGGLGTLCDTLAGKVRTLNYRSIRYPGHGAIMKMLLQDLRLAERREVLKDIFENALPSTLQDVVVIFVTASGRMNGRLTQQTYAHKVYSGLVGGTMRSAIQITTASGICAVLDLLAQGALPQRGFVRQEDIGFEAFLANRFGRAYARPEDLGREPGETGAARAA